MLGRGFTGNAHAEHGSALQGILQLKAPAEAALSRFAGEGLQSRALGSWGHEYRDFLTVVIQLLGTDRQRLVGLFGKQIQA